MDGICCQFNHNKKNSNIVVFDNEYGSNYISLINNNFNVRVSKLKENGEISFEDLKEKLIKIQL